MAAAIVLAAAAVASFVSLAKATPQSDATTTAESCERTICILSLF